MEKLLLEKIDGERIVEYRAVTTRLNVNDIAKLNKYAKTYKSTACGLVRAAVEAMLAELDQAAETKNNSASVEGGVR